jgi:hypothetical protein
MGSRHGLAVAEERLLGKCETRDLQKPTESSLEDGAIMARWRAETEQDVTNFDGCGFGKYWVISFRLALLMPLKPSVRGSNPCGAPINWRVVLGFGPVRAQPHDGARMARFFGVQRLVAALLFSERAIDAS